jgi:predicted glutamine amidotransferase
MCLIIICKPGSQKNPAKSEFLKEAIQNGYKKNQDGWGFSYNTADTEKSLRVFKSLYDDNELIHQLIKENIPKESTLVIHLRNTSAGSSDILNAHPFILSENESEMCEDDVITENPVLFHNGTFYAYKNSFNIVSGFSDTYYFAKNVMRVPELLALLKRDEKTLESILGSTIASNKICVLYPDGEYKGFGTFIMPSSIDHKDLYLFSNDQYMTPITYDYYKNSNNVSKYNTSDYADETEDYNSIFYGNYKPNSIDDYTPKGFSLKPEKTDNSKNNKPSKYEFTKVPSINDNEHSVSSNNKHGDLRSITIKVTPNNYNELCLTVDKPFMSLETTLVYCISKLDKYTMHVYPINNPEHTILTPTETLLNRAKIIAKKEFAAKYIDYKSLKQNMFESKNNIRKLAAKLKEAFEKNKDTIHLKKLGHFRTDSCALYYAEFKHLLSDKEINSNMPVIVEP